MSEAEGAMRLTDELVAKIENLRPYNPQAIARWLDYLHGSRVGWLEIFARDWRQRNGDVATQWYRWPEQRADAVRYAAAACQDNDVWAAALLKNEKRRTTELPGRFAWVDADLKKRKATAEAEIGRLHPAAVRSGTPGNLQLWVPLDVDTDPAQIQAINKILIDRIGGDAKHDPTSLMRIPGTLNHKPCESGTHACNRVRWEWGAVTTWSSGGFIFGRGAAQAEPELTDDTEDPDWMPDPIDIGPIPDKLKAAYRASVQDPSEHSQHVAYVAASMYKEPGEILAALEHDEVTTLRRSEKKRGQPGWWPAEFQRLLANARAKYPAELAGKTVPAMLVNMARNLYSFGVADDGEPFALPKAGPQVVRMLRGDRYSLRSELSRRYADATGNPPSQGSLNDALVTLDGICQEVPPVPLPLRVARHEGGLVLDLGDESGRAVIVQPGHWWVAETSPVLLRRTRLTAALPVPEGGKKLSEVLFPLINVPRADWSLMAAILVSMLFPDIPHPIPLLTGAEGVAKTSTTRLLRSLVDPSSVPTRGRPDERDWDVALAAQWIIALDNLSEIKPWLSDALCRAVTGEGTVKRKLYTDLDMSLINARRVVILNGISAVPSSADLAGRVITFELEPVREYKNETDLDAAWAHAQPYALGALLDMAAAALPLIPSMKAGPVFRMADFATILMALDAANGTNAEARYRDKLRDASEDVINSDIVAPVLLSWAKHLDEPWTGTLRDLSAALVGHVGGKLGGWPATEIAFMNKIKRISNPLRRSGVIIERAERTKTARNWTVTRDELS